MSNATYRKRLYHVAVSLTHLIAVSPTQVNLVFIANIASDKFDEIKNDSHVNVSFYDASNTSWASYAGTAQISQDKEKIAKHWSS